MRNLWIVPLILGAFSWTTYGQDAGAAEYRTFTSTSGKTVRARLIKVENGEAILRLSSGQETRAPIGALSGEDQAYIQTWDPRERYRVAAKDSTVDVGLARFMLQKGYASAKLTQKGKSILIDVKVNDEPHVFTFDSGRVLSLLDKPISDRFGATTDVDFGEFPTISGGTEKVWAGTLKSFEVAAQQIPEFEIGVVTLKNIGLDGDGIFGADVLQYFDGIVDWGSMKIYLTKNP